MSWIYVHHLSPFLVQTHLFGHSIGIRWYGLAYVLGLWAAFYAYQSAWKRDYLKNLHPEAQAQMIFVVALGVVGGGRLGYVLQHIPRLLSHPLFPFEVWNGGMTSFGGLIGVILALQWTAKRYDVNFWTLCDVGAFPATFGLAIGRIANFINGELIGHPTNGHWGVIFPHIDNVPRHPSQLYESAAHFLVLGIMLWLLAKKPRLGKKFPGFFASLFLTLYGILRFFTDFYRADHTYYGPLSNGQWASLVTAIVGMILFVFLYLRKTRQPEASQEHNTTANIIPPYKGG